MLAERALPTEPVVWFPSAAGPPAPPFVNYWATPFRSLAASHDPELLCHLDRVAFAASEFARHLGLSRREQAFIAFVGFVHDIGKVFIPLGILNKRGRLTADEFAAMQKHVEIGVQIVKHLPSGEHIARIVREHHERVDGTGYPNRLRGDDISFLSRILSISDAYCAMIESRVYRAVEVDPISELLAGAGTQFDGDLARAFVARLAQGPIFEG